MVAGLGHLLLLQIVFATLLMIISLSLSVRLSVSVCASVSDSSLGRHSRSLSFALSLSLRSNRGDPVVARLGVVEAVVVAAGVPQQCAGGVDLAFPLSAELD